MFTKIPINDNCPLIQLLCILTFCLFSYLNSSPSTEYKFFSNVYCDVLAIISKIRTHKQATIHLYEFRLYSHHTRQLFAADPKSSLVKYEHLFNK